MTLEERINNLLLPEERRIMGTPNLNLKHCLPIESWHAGYLNLKKEDLYWINSQSYYAQTFKDEVDKLIETATNAECLTSPSEYIREYKKSSNG